MELIVDSADLEVVKEFDSLLEVSGVTTNPSIIIKSGKSPERAIDDILGYLRPDQKFFAQVVRTDFEGIMEEARAICALRPENTYAKIPVTRAGLRAIKEAKREGLSVLATGIHSAERSHGGLLRLNLRQIGHGGLHLRHDLCLHVAHVGHSGHLRDRAHHCAHLLQSRLLRRPGNLLRALGFHLLVCHVRYVLRFSIHFILRRRPQAAARRSP